MRHFSIKRSSNNRSKQDQDHLKQQSIDNKILPKLLLHSTRPKTTQQNFLFDCCSVQSQFPIIIPSNYACTHTSHLSIYLSYFLLYDQFTACMLHLCSFTFPAYNSSSVLCKCQTSVKIPLEKTQIILLPNEIVKTELAKKILLLDTRLKQWVIVRSVRQVLTLLVLQEYMDTSIFKKHSISGNILPRPCTNKLAYSEICKQNIQSTIQLRTSDRTLNILERTM